MSNPSEISVAVTAPANKEEHVARAMALTETLVAFANAQVEHPDVLLDALLNAYINAAFSFGRQHESARGMAQVAGQILLSAALDAQPPTSSAVH